MENKTQSCRWLYTGMAAAADSVLVKFSVLSAFLDFFLFFPNIFPPLLPAQMPAITCLFHKTSISPLLDDKNPAC